MLLESTVEEYQAFDQDHATRVLIDLANFSKLGEFAKGARRLDFRLTDSRLALEFANSHGLLWHGPTKVGDGELRESLRDWFIAGLELWVSTALYLSIRQAQLDNSAEPVRRFLRTMRDAGIFKRVRLSDDDSELLEFACIQLADRISRGMSDCTPTLTAACSLLKDGDKVGEAGDFRFGNDPSSLVGAANYRLAHLITKKKRVIFCDECKEMMIQEHGSQRYHEKCGARKRQREKRQREKRQRERKARLARGQ